MNKYSEIPIIRSKYTYPNIEIRTWYERQVRYHNSAEVLIFYIELTSHVRKRHECKWFLIPVKRMSECVLMPTDNKLEKVEKTITQTFEIYLRDVWNAYHLYLIDTNVRLVPDNRPAIFIDEDQRETEDILKDTLFK